MFSFRNKLLLLYLLLLVGSNDNSTMVRTYFGRKLSGGDVPSIVRVLIDDRFICSGSIISVNWVLSAAHCFKTRKYNCKVEVGSDGYTYYQMFRCVNVIIHPQYYNDYVVADISLLKVTPKIQLRNNVQIIDVENEPWPTINKFRKCYFAGFGYNYRLGRTGVLHGGPVTVGQGVKACCTGIPNYLKLTLICLHPEEHDSLCHGDSGGPISCTDEPSGISKLVGVHHALYKCMTSTKYRKSQSYCADRNVASTSVYLYPYLPWLTAYVSCIPNCTISGSTKSFFISNTHIYQMLTLNILISL